MCNGGETLLITSDVVILTHPLMVGVALMIISDVVILTHPL